MNLEILANLRRTMHIQNILPTILAKLVQCNMVPKKEFQKSRSPHLVFTPSTLKRKRLAHRSLRGPQAARNWLESGG